MEDKSKKKEDREIADMLETYRMGWSEARGKKITGLVIDEDGDKYWFLNGIWHREDGPAVEWANGSKLWYLNGQIHSEDGPAVEWADGNKEWCLNGKMLTEQEWKIKVRKKKIGRLLTC